MQIHQAADYCRRHCPGEIKHLHAISERVMGNTFLFDQEWDMERTYEPVTFQGEIDWALCPADDQEWTFMLARHGFILNLAQAAIILGKRAYAQKALELMLDFIRRVPLTDESQKTAWRTIDAAIRADNWLRAWPVIMELAQPSPAQCDIVRESMRVHARYLFDTYDVFRIRSNWGVIGNMGLFAAGLFLREERYMEAALERTAASMRVQLFGDGFHWEQSPMYHNEVLLSLLHIAAFTQLAGRETPQFLRDSIRRMAWADLASAKPNHRQVIQSDSDDTDLRGIITCAAVMLADSALKAGGYARADCETAFLCEKEAIEKYEALFPISPKETAHFFEDSGNYYVRSSWEEDAAFLHFHCGALGSGHGHSDQLHIDTFYAGEDVLTDSGRYTYVDKALRRTLKEPAAHNTIVADGLDFTEYAGSWEFGRRAQPVRLPAVQRDGFALLEAAHLGYMDQGEGVFPLRKILWLSQDLFVIIDCLYSAGAHLYTQYFHFSPQGRAALAGKNRCVYESGQVRSTLYHLSPLADSRIERTPYSDHYNLLSEKDTLINTAQAAGFCAMATVVHTTRLDGQTLKAVQMDPIRSAKTGEPLPPDTGCTVSIEQADGTRFAAAVLFTESLNDADLMDVSGQYVAGRVTVVKDGAVTVLAY